MTIFKVKLYTSNIVEGGQDYFSISFSYDDDSLNAADVAPDVIDEISENAFIANDEGTRWYRTSAITDFYIEKLGAETE